MTQPRPIRPFSGGLWLAVLLAMIGRPASLPAQSDQDAKQMDRTARMTEMRRAAERLQAVRWDPNNQRSELRLMPQPAHRYSEPSSGVLDGGLFLLCHDTNPEVIVLLEAVQVSGKAQWKFALQRLGHAEMHVHIDGREVWQCPRVANTGAEDHYTLVIEPIARPAERKADSRE